MPTPTSPNARTLDGLVKMQFAAPESLVAEGGKAETWFALVEHLVQIFSDDAIEAGR
jgi:hypothetical protein